MSEKDRKKKFSGRYHFYAVAKGTTTGIYKNWLQCSASVSVNGFSGASFKGLNLLRDAELYLRNAGTPCKWIDFDDHYVETLMTLMTSDSLVTLILIQETDHQLLQHIVERNLYP